MGFGGILNRVYGYFLIFLLVANFVVILGFVGLMVYTTNEIESKSDKNFVPGLQRVYDSSFWLFWAVVLFQAFVVFPLMYKRFG